VINVFQPCEPSYVFSQLLRVAKSVNDKRTIGSVPKLLGKAVARSRRDGRFEDYKPLDKFDHYDIVYFFY